MKKLSIKFVLIAMLLAITLVPLIFSTFMLINRYDRELRSNVKEQQRLVAEANALTMDNWLTMKSNALEEIYTKNRELLLKGDTREIIPLLKTLKTTDPENISFSYTTEEGTSYGSDGVVTDFSKETDNFKAIQKIKITDVMSSEGNNLIIIIIPLREDSGKYAGNLFSVMNADQLLKDLKASQEAGETNVFLLSSNGTYIAHRDNSLTGKTMDTNMDSKVVGLFKNSVLKEPRGSIEYSDPEDREVIASFAAVEKTGWKVVVTGNTKDLLADAAKSKQLAFVMITITNVAVALLALFFSRMLLRPILSLSLFMKNVAGGDLSKRLPVRWDNEFGSLQHSINEMLEALSLLVMNIETAIRETAATSGTMASLSENTAQAAKSISQAVSETVENAKVQVQGSEQSARVTEEISEGIQHIATSTSSMANHFGDVIQAVNEGSDNIQRIDRQMADIHVYFNTVSDDVKQLLLQTAEIRTIGLFISTVAKQTNILALNAGIEAARAGAGGRGFAVVAEEIKKLAGETSAAAGQITQLVNNIESQTRRTFQSMDSGLLEAGRGVEAAGKAGESFEEIVQLVQNVNPQIKQVSATVQQILAGSEEISASMNDILDASRAAMERLAEIDGTAEAQSHTMTRIAVEAEAQTLLSAKLEELICNFTVSKVNEE